MNEMSAFPSDTRDAIDAFDMAQAVRDREDDRYRLHEKHLNEQMVKVLKTIGYDVSFTRGVGPYLWDRNDAKYLDLLSGWGVFALGRNHPDIRRALASVIDADLPNLVQMDVSVLSGLLAEQLLAFAPYMDKVFFANSGAEAVEAAMKFARSATGRPGVLFCDHAFHGLTYGALSLNGDGVFRDGFGPLLPGAAQVPFNDLAALEAALRKRDIAAFFVEPIQGKGVVMPDGDYLSRAAALCRQYGTLFVADEIQTGLGRTGKFLAVEHYGVEPDMVLLAKALSGGHVPIGAVLTRRKTFEKVFNRMDRAVVHGSTFAKNDLGMAAGLATLRVIENEGLVANAARTGDRLLASFEEMRDRYELVKTIRGKGLMIGVVFRTAEIAEAKGGVEPPGGRQRGPVLPAHHHPALQGTQGAGPGGRTWQPLREASARADDRRTRLRLDRFRVRCRDRRQPSRPGRRVDARQDVGRSRAESPGGRLRP